MNKSVLTLALLSLLGAGVQARTLSPVEALAPVMTFGEASAPSLYVFDGENAGYLIVAADDVAVPVLGYSDSGTFDPDNIPVNLRWWLGEYSRQIEAAVKAGRPDGLSTPREPCRQSVDSSPRRHKMGSGCALLEHVSRPRRRAYRDRLRGYGHGSGDEIFQLAGADRVQCEFLV